MGSGSFVAGPDRSARCIAVDNRHIHPLAKLRWDETKGRSSCRALHSRLLRMSVSKGHCIHFVNINTIGKFGVGVVCISRRFIHEFFGG